MLDSNSSSLCPVVDHDSAEQEVDRLEELIYVSALEGEQYADLLKRMGLTRRRLVGLKQALLSARAVDNRFAARKFQIVCFTVCGY